MKNRFGIKQFFFKITTSKNYPTLILKKYLQELTLN